MSYHNDPYRVDHLKIYPCLKERPDVLEVMKKSDRKMKYMEVDLKSEQRRKNAENGAESYVPSKEDSLERLVYSAKCQFADDAEGVEDPHSGTDAYKPPDDPQSQDALES